MTLVSPWNTGLTAVEQTAGAGGGCLEALCILAAFSTDMRMVKIFFVCTSGDHLGIL